MATTVADLEVRATGNTKDAERSLDNLNSKVKFTEADTKKAGLAFMGMGTAVVGGLGLAVNTAMNFESAISGIGAVAGLTGDQLELVRQKALQLGADTVFSATESAAAMETLLKAGMPIATVLKDGAQAALDLAAAAGTDVVTSAELITNAMNVFGESAGTATDVANSFNAAANTSAASIESLALGFSQAAQPAQLMGLSLEDLNVALALFSKHGLTGSDAGTSFKTMLLSMLDPTKEQAAMMDQLGISFFDAQGQFIGLDATAQMLRDTMGKLDPETRNTALAVLFGSDAVRAAGALYDEGADGVNNFRTEMAGQATASEQAAARMDNLKGAIEQLKGSIETAMIMVGSIFTPALQKLAEGVQAVVKWFTTLSPNTQKLIGIGIALAGAFLLVVGASTQFAAVMAIAAAGAALLVSPVALITLAIIGLGVALTIAYKKNLLGFADAVDYVAGILVDGAKAVYEFVSALVAVFRSGRKVSDIVGDFPKPLQKFMKGILLVTDAIGDLVAAWRSGGFEHMLDVLPQKLAQVKQGLRIFADALKDALKAGVKAAFDYLKSVDWGAVLSAVWEGVKTIVPIIGQALALIPGLIGDLIGSIVTGFAPLDQIFEGVGQQWKGFAEVIRGIFNLDFKQVFDGLKMMLTGLGTELIGIGNLILTGLRAGFEAAWPYVVEFVSNIPGWILTAIGEVASWLGQKGQDFISGLKNGASDFWDTDVKTWFEGLPDKIKSAIGRVITGERGLVQKGKDFLTSLKEGIVAGFTGEGGPNSWFMSLHDKIKSAIGSVISGAKSLVQKGKDFLTGLKTGITNAWDGGAGEGGGLRQWFVSLPGKIVAAIPNAIGALVQTGKDLIQGLANGIDAMKSIAEAAARRVRDAVLGILKDVPGFSPIEHVGQFYGGKLGMGFAEGIAAAIPDTIKAAAELTNGGMAQMARATPIVPTAPVTAQPSGPRSIIYQTNHYTVSIDQLEDVARAAEFVRDLPGERELVLGGAFAM